MALLPSTRFQPRAALSSTQVIPLTLRRSILTAIRVVAFQTREHIRSTRMAIQAGRSLPDSNQQRADPGFRCRLRTCELTEHRIRALALLSLALLTACGDSAPSEDPIERATRLQAEGQPEAALCALREAMRATPEDPEIRLLLAEVYLDLDQGDLAGAALDQALDRGLAPARAVLPRARALFAEGRLLDVIELPMPAELGVGDLVRVRFIKAEARAARSTVTNGSTTRSPKTISSYSNCLNAIVAIRSSTQWRHNSKRRARIDWK